jgi:hypothetical protein
LRFIFNLKLILNSNYFKMASVRVQFSPVFPLGGGFPAEQFLFLFRYISSVATLTMTTGKCAKR